MTSRVAVDRDRFNGQIRIVVRDRFEPAHICIHWMNDREAHTLGSALLNGTQPATIAKLVLDSAEFAWNEVSWLGLDRFASDYRDQLNQAACLLMQQALIEAWARRRRLVQLVDKATFLAAPKATTDPSDETWREVWQEAAQSIDLDALLTTTDLIHEHTHYEN